MKVNYRPAQPKDAKEIAHYLHVASGGLSNFLLHDIFPNCQIEDLIALGVVEENSTISYSNTIVAEVSGKVVGILNQYPAEEHCVPDIMHAFIPSDRIAHIMSFFNPIIPDSLYIHALAVAPECSYFNIGLNFVCLKSIPCARMLGLSKLSAHVWKDNTRVLDVLLRRGFIIEKEIDIAFHPLIPHPQGMALMSYDIKDV